MSLSSNKKQYYVEIIHTSRIYIAFIDELEE
jgi:hypothetical protein